MICKQTWFMALCIVVATGDYVAAQTVMTNVATAKAIYERNLAEHGENADMLVLPGLLADRRDRWIELDAESSAIKDGDPVEFVLVDQASSHDYESLFLSYAAPGAVDRALRFIGMAPGQPVDPGNLRFWAKGERVIVTVDFADDDKGRMPVEVLMWDSAKKAVFEALGFVYTGSRRVSSPADPNQEVLVADVTDPRAILPNYSESASVLDVPRWAPQGEVYGSQVANPDFVNGPGRLVKIRIAPEYLPGRKRVVDLKLDTVVKQDADGETVVFRLTGLPDRGVLEGVGLAEVLKEFVGLQEGGQDPYVSVSFAPEVTLGSLKSICQILSRIETPNGIRIEPPAKDQFYYRAFVPDESYLVREKRIAQPWELHLEQSAVEGGATLTQITQVWNKQSIWPDLKVEDIPLNGPADLGKELDARGPGLPVILVYARPEMTLGYLSSYVMPVRDKYPTMHMLLVEPTPDQTSGSGPETK